MLTQSILCRIVPFTLLLMVLSGCTTSKETFPGFDAGQVWTTMKAVAESPEYDDWHVKENEVWSDPEQARLEVYRVVRRAVYKPRSRPRTETRTWRLRLVLEETDPPTARFISRGFGVPGHAMQEAERYFRDVWAMLESDPPAPRRAAEPLDEESDDAAEESVEEDEDSQVDPALIDVDDLDAGNG